MRQRFDKAYYDRFYRDPRTRAVTPAAARRQAAFIAAYLRYLEMPVRHILDMGCGTGMVLRALGRQFPQARTRGVEVSDYLCRRYNWASGSVVDYVARQTFDLVVCTDVLAYLNDRDCGRAIANLARLSRGALYLSVVTADDADLFDPARTDSRQQLRPAAWYRRRLNRHFMNVGGGLYLKQPSDVVVWNLERAP
ncbi:MAG: class I SAM-dependent methyltransferase [Gammaproteobacteria bacterium]|nr:class I SAM-dependent methyltransferase [Gammaproteobacteria bacterium]